MAVSFPPLCPTKRNFKPGQYPVKKFNAISGSSTTRLYGSKAFDASLDLEFLVTDAELAILMIAWHSAKGTYKEVSLPDRVWDGLTKKAQDSFEPDSLKWRWAEIPSVESVFKGRSRVSASFIANLE